MNNFTRFVYIAHSGALMDFCDHQLSIEYKMDIVRYKSGTQSVLSISIITAFSHIFLLKLYKQSTINLITSGIQYTINLYNKGVDKM